MLYTFTNTCFRTRADISLLVWLKSLCRSHVTFKHHLASAPVRFFISTAEAVQCGIVTSEDEEEGSELGPGDRPAICHKPEETQHLLIGFIWTYLIK